MLAEARAHLPRTVAEIDAYLTNNPDGLTFPDAACPLGIVRLTHVLLGHGHPVKPPACTGCGERTWLPHQGDQGRICDRCRNLRRQPVACTRCGRAGTIHARIGAEVLCRYCYRLDPQFDKICPNCGPARPIDRRDQSGAPLCATCAPRRHRTCVECGRQRPAHALTPNGPVCSACYTRSHQPARRCGRCGNTGPIAIRAKGDQPDVCVTCLNAETSKRRAAARPPKLPRQPAPRSQRPARPPTPPRIANCVRCQRYRKITVYRPIGPACDTCYAETREHPARCAGCSEIRVLIAEDADGQPICEPCAGSPFDYRCSRCGVGARVYAAGNCFRCCVDIKLTEVLGTDDGLIPAHLQPLVSALLAAERPRSVLVWLNRSAAAQLLTEVAAHPELPTHAVLDSFPPSRTVHFVRRMLVNTGILPTRTEYLERIVPWLDATLTSHSASHVRLIRPYAQWHLLRRARRRARYRGDSPSSASAIRETIRVALEFLVWLEEHGHELDRLTQDGIDQWLAETPTTRRNHRARHFLAWAISRQLTPRNLSIPAIRVGQPETFTDAEEYARQLRGCLYDDHLPIDVRAGGALILLFGVRIVDVLAIRRSQLIQRDGDARLQIGATSLLLPPILATLLAELPAHRTNRLIVQGNDTSELLFPGVDNAQPRDRGMFGRRLREHGIEPLGGRDAARLALAADLPASVLAHLLGIHDGTATRWAQRANRDWQAYLAQRITGRDEPGLPYP